MFIVEQRTGRRFRVTIEPVDGEDYKEITKARYYFNWKMEKGNAVFKLRRSDDSQILGLLSLVQHETEPWLQVNLLAVSKENRGKGKQYDRIAGTLIGYACREAMRIFGKDACIFLESKSELKKHYMSKYGMEDAGKQRLFLAGLPLIRILNNYEL